MKSKEISKEEKEEFNKNQKLETSNSGRKDQEDSITNKNIFYIDKKNKPLFKVGPPNISNSTTKDSIISNIHRIHALNVKIVYFLIYQMPKIEIKF